MRFPTAQVAAAETFCAQSDFKELKPSSFFRVGELLTGDQVLYDVLARGEWGLVLARGEWGLSLQVSRHRLQLG